MVPAHVSHKCQPHQLRLYINLKTRYMHLTYSNMLYIYVDLDTLHVYISIARYGF